MIAFNTISANINVPGSYIEFDTSRAVRGTPQMPHRILVIAPRLATGTLAALTASRVRSAAEGEAFCGRGSLGAAMIAAAKEANPYTDMHVIGVADHGAGVAATGQFAVTGPATAPGSLALYIAGKKIAVAVANGDTANTIAAAINTAIGADTSLPVTASVTTNVVTVTAKNKGTTGNDIDLRLNYNTGDATPSGVAVAITAMANGATNPDLATVTAAIGDGWYHTLITPWTDSANLTVLESFLVARWGGMVMKEGFAFGCVGGTYSAIDTVVAARNSAFVPILAAQKSPFMPCVIAASLGAIDAGQAESITNCNRPRKTLELVGILPPKESDRYTWTERNQLIADGASTYIVDEGGVCRLERVVTTYKTSNGVPDKSMRSIEIMRGNAYLRYSLRVRIALRFPRHKLADNGTPVSPYQPIVTPNDIRDEIIALGAEWLDAGLIENYELFKRELFVERNADDRDRVDAIIPPDCINSFNVFAAQVQYRL